MQNAAYWRDRALLLRQSALDRGADYAHTAQEEFARAEARIQRDILTWYQRFAVNNAITLAEARKQLTSGQRKEFRWSVEEYIRAGESLDPAWARALENASARVHVNRLEALQLQLQQEIEVLYGNHLDALDALLRQVYADGYYHSAFEVQRGFGIGWDFQGLDACRLRAVLGKPWSTDGKTFRDRCWTDRTALVAQVKTGLTQAVIRGDHPEKVADALAKRFQVSKAKAARLAMTESAFFSSAAQKDCFLELDVERFEVVETLDGHTCPICQGLDGKVLPMEDFEPGVTAPPFHPWCRGATAPWFPDDYGERAARDRDREVYYVPGDITYEKWIQRHNLNEEGDIGNFLRRTVKSITIHDRVVDFKGLPKSFQKTFRVGLVNATPETKALLQREYRNTDYIVSQDKRSYYRRSNNIITIGQNASPSTLAHELFHKLDTDHNISKTLLEGLSQDYVALNVASMGDIKSYLVNKFPSAFAVHEVFNKLYLKEKFRGIADILNGLSNGQLNLGYYHSSEYWSHTGALESEAWAQFGRIQYENDLDVLNMLTELFPNFNKDAMLALKGLI